MVEMAYGLPYKHEDYMVAINLVDAQLELDLSQSPFAREQERYEMMRILNDELRHVMSASARSACLTSS